MQMWFVPTFVKSQKSDLHYTHADVVWTIQRAFAEFCKPSFTHTQMGGTVVEIFPPLFYDFTKIFLC